MISSLGTFQPFSPTVMPAHGTKITYTSISIVEVWKIGNNVKIYQHGTSY